LKIAVIGGGSTYTPELYSGLLERRERLGLDSVVLHDVGDERLEPVAGFCRRLTEHAGSPLRVSSTLDLDAALDGASFVIVQIRIGGQQGRHEDIQLGLRHGLIGQETTGVGGFAKALRTVPVVVDLAREIEARCPDAWMINFTNPSGMVTEAILRHGRERAVGLCNVPIEMHMDIAEVLRLPREQVELDWVGLNHLGWVRRVLVDGKDRLPELLEQIDEGVSGPANLPEIDYPEGLLRSLGMLPSSYVRFFYMPGEMLAEIREAKKSRAEQVMEIEDALIELYRDPAQKELPELLQQRGGAWYSRLAVEVVEALGSDTPSVHIVNHSNDGAVPDLPEDASVEVPCRVSRAGVEAIPVGPVEESILGLMRQVKAYERLAVDASLERDRAKAYLALLAHPLVPDAETANAVLGDLVTRGLC